MNAAPTAPLLPRRRRPWAVLATAALWALVAVAALVILTWGVLHGVIVPRIGEWRPQVERLATQTLGVRVTIGAIQAESTGPIPAIELHDVRLFDTANREALHLPRVLAALSITSLWQGGFEQLVLDGPTLGVRRTSDRRIEVAGLGLSGVDSDQPGALANWFFSQAEFAIRQGTLHWTDDTRPQAPPLTLRDVDLAVRNPGVQHQIRLDATPPADWGSRFSLQGHWRQPLWERSPGRWRHWSGTLYGDWPQVDLKRLREYADTHADLGLELREGAGALRVWLDMQRGALTQATADVALRTVALQLGKAPAPLQLDNLSGRVDIARTAQRLEVATHGLAFTTREGQTWPGGNARLVQTQNEQGEWLQRLLEADRLDLTALRQLATHLPLDDTTRDWLNRLQPAGLVRTLALDWSAPRGDQPPRWKAKGELAQLHLEAGPVPTPSAEHPHPLGRPGVHNLDVHFEGDQTGGKAEVVLQKGHLEFPGLFEEPRIPTDTFKTQLTWQVQGERWDVRLPNLRFANADAEGEAQLHWHTADPATSGSQRRFPGVLDLNATLQRANAAQVPRYLPLAIPTGVRRYLREAIPKGTARQATFQVKGDLWDFPYGKHPTGRFAVSAKLSEVELNYAPAYLTPNGSGWPGLQRLEAELDIDKTALRLRNASAVVHGQPTLRATKGQAEIADYTHDARLVVQARATGPASEALAFVNRSALRGMTGDALAQASMGGNADIGFKLDLPLNRLEGTRVEGSWALAGNDIQITPDTPKLEGTQGGLTFTETGFTVSRATTRVLGGDLRFEGGLKTQGGEHVLQFRGQGNATAAGLRSATYLDLPTPLTRALQGGAAYQLQLGFKQGRPEILLTSNLQGLALDWPAPLGKTAGTTLPLRYEMSALSPGAGGPRDRVAVDLGSPPVAVAQAAFEREWRGNAPVVTRGLLRLQDTGRTALNDTHLPAAGVQADVVLGTLDIDPWTQLWGGGGPAQAGAAPVPNRYWPTTLRLQADTVVQAGRAFHNVVLGGTQDNGTWRVNLQSKEANGYAEYRPNQGNQPGRVYARLAQLSLNPAMTTGVENLLDQNPTSIPALDVEVQDFELHGRKLGQLDIEASNRGGTASNPDAAREWRLTRLNLTLPEATLEGTGNWASLATPGGGPRTSGTRRTALTFKLDIRDSGALLKRFGMPDTIRGGKGSLQGAIGWVGSPASIHYPSLSGQLALALERGQFLKAEPGIAKLLGVLSLQSLPRRLALDFRDVFSEGFVFDFVRGDAKVEQGVASTNNLQMKGVTAAVLLEGSADLANETQDITAVVIPELNAGTASLLATAINPAVGLGTFLAQFLLRQPLQDAATQQFHITGPWAEPKVEKISKRAVVREGTSP